MRRRNAALALVSFAAGALAATLLLTASLRTQLHREHFLVAHTSLALCPGSRERAERLGSLAPTHDGHRPVPPARRPEVPIEARGCVRAQSVVPSDAGVLLRVAVMLLAIAAMLALPLLELARLADRAEQDCPARYLERQLLRIRARDLRFTWRLIGGSEDVRLRFLRDQLLLLDEEYQRVARLVDSLRRTEPDSGRRGRMAELLIELRRRFRFAAAEGPVDRSVWPAQETAGTFAVLTLLLANLSLGGGGNLPYAPDAAAYSAPLALSLWSAGLLAGTRVSLRWPLRLLLALTLTVLTNLLMMRSAAWSEQCAHLAGGFATALAATAALAAVGGSPRRTLVTLLVAASGVGPGLGLAATAALNPFGDVGGLYAVAAALALMTAAWLSYRLPEGIGIGSPSRRAARRLVGVARMSLSRAARLRLQLEPVLAGAAWSAAIMAFVAQVSANREQALRLLVLQLPGLYLLASRRAWMQRALALILLAVCGGWLLRLAWPVALPFLGPGPASAVGAASLGGTFALLRDHRGVPGRMLSGVAAGALAMLTAVAGVGALWPQAALRLELWAVLLAVSLGLLRPGAAGKGATRARGVAASEPI